MDCGDTHSELVTRVADLDETGVLSLVQEQLEKGVPALSIITECEQGMILVGERYERHEYFLSGLIMAGEIFRQVIGIAQPYMDPEADRTLSGSTPPHVLLGTVQGDIHSIGKDIVHILLRCFGFTVEDLGVNVPPQVFVARAVASKPSIIGLSCLFTTAYGSMAETIRLLRTDTHGETRDIPIIIGGSQINSDVCRRVGADYWASEGPSGIRLIREIAQKQR